MVLALEADVRTAIGRVARVELATTEKIERCAHRAGDCVRSNGKNIVVWLEPPTVTGDRALAHVMLETRMDWGGSRGGSPVSGFYYEVQLRRTDAGWVVSGIRQVAGS